MEICWEDMYSQWRGDLSNDNFNKEIFPMKIFQIKILTMRFFYETILMRICFLWRSILMRICFLWRSFQWNLRFENFEEWILLNNFGKFQIELTQYFSRNLNMRLNDAKNISGSLLQTNLGRPTINEHTFTGGYPCSTSLSFSDA